MSADYLTHFSKHFGVAENGGHFDFSNFSQNLQNTKMLISLLDRAISTKFLIQGYLCGVANPIFKTFWCRRKWSLIFCKNCQKRLISLSKTVLDRVILMKVLTHRVSLKSTNHNFQKKFLLSKMAAILNFFAKTAKHKNAYISKTVRDKLISANFFNHRVSLQSSHPNFQQSFVSPKMVAILNFQKNCNTQKCLYRE